MQENADVRNCAWEVTLSTEDSVFSKDGFWSQSKPDWSKWERVTHCLLWQAVVLACDVDPTIYQPGGLPAEITEDFGLTPVPPKVKELLSLAKIAFGSGTLKVLPNDELSLMQGEVDLSDFTSWLHSIRHRTPESYPWTAAELDTRNLQWPWGNHHTKGLAMLAKAADKFWKNYDPSDPTTAPTNETVMAWLKENGVAERKAEAIASLLRPENLAPGPRKK